MLPIIENEESPFPPLELALAEPNGLLAVGGSLSSQRLVSAYRQGIFPWYEEDQPILWWSPDPRIGMAPENAYISSSMAKFMRKTKLSVSLNQDFSQVIHACAELRSDNTWISPQMQAAYIKLHRLGHAHSIEVWDNKQLVGGLYGINCGSIFCGESMFHRQSNASKLAFVSFCRHFAAHGGTYIDGQVENPHLISLGMQRISRHDFIQRLQAGLTQNLKPNCWRSQTLPTK